MAATELLRLLPAVDGLLDDPRLAGSRGLHGHELVVAALRAGVDRLRQEVLSGALGSEETLQAAAEDLIPRAVAELDERAQGTLHDVLNATGVIVHTNLGRAPLGEAAVKRLAERAGQSLDIELDLETGKRGRRAPGCEDLLAELTGAEAACIVNNCAAALLLSLNSLSMGKPVVVSRGELVEIGGSFRIPDVCSRAGVRLREVGTTNRTRLADYRAAAEEETPGLLLKVHPSNFRVVGFTEETTIDQLVGLGKEVGVPVVMDQGSGALEDLSPWGVLGEDPVPDFVKAGADLVLFSGDKLLGGPQAGCIVGKKDAVAACRKNALYRALRPGRLTLLALEATLWAHRTGSLDDLPVLQRMKLSVETIRARAERLRDQLAAGGLESTLVEGSSKSGGGSSPEANIPTVLVRVKASKGPDRMAAALRAGRPAVMARIEDDALMIDLRTIPEARDEELGTALLAAG